MSKLLSFVVLVAALAHLASANAQTYPLRPVTIIVPFAAGGPSDAVARILGERMRATLGQTFLIENVVGAGGSLGVARAVRAPADGYTISYGHLGTHVFNGAIYPLQFDLLTDLEPLALLPSNPMVVVSTNRVPAKTLRELIAWLKANQTKVTAGTAGAVPRPRRSHSWRVRRPWAGGQMLCAGRPLAGQPAHEHAIAEGGPVTTSGARPGIGARRWL